MVELWEFVKDNNKGSYDLQVGYCIVERSMALYSQGENISTSLQGYSNINNVKKTIFEESNKMTLVYSYPAQSLLTVKKTGMREFKIVISAFNGWD